MERKLGLLLILCLALPHLARAETDLNAAFAKKLLWADFQAGLAYSSTYDMTNFNGALGSNRADASCVDALIDVGVRAAGFLIVGAGAFVRLGFADLMKDPLNGSQLGYQLTPAAPMAALDFFGKYRLQAHYLRWGSFSRWSPTASGTSVSYGSPVGGRITFTRLGVVPSKLGLRFNASLFFEVVEYHQQSLNSATLADLAAPMRFMTTGATFGFDF